jgi:hypothetical protein
MSTRCSLKWRDQELEKPGFHLWEDAFERLDHGEQAPVYLRLEGVQIHELETQFAGAAVTVQLPRETAVALGLLAATEPKP